jgi:MATE family multidrug resistance protein
MRRIGFVGIALAGLVIGAFALVFILANESIAKGFVSSPAVIALTAQLLLIAALFQVADGVQVAAIASLRGMADVRVPAIMAVAAYWLIAVPLAYALAFRFGHGAVGIWLGLATGLGVAAIGLSWRFHWRTQRRELAPAPVAICDVAQ